MPSPPKNLGKRKNPPSTSDEEVRGKVACISVETPSADLETRGEPIVEAEVLSLPAVDLPELPPSLSSVADSDLRSPLVQVWHLFGFID